MSLVVVVEGHGESEAIRNLVSRLAKEDGLTLPHIPARGGVQRLLIQTRRQLEAACDRARSRGPTALLLTRDADNDSDPDGDCPGARAPEAAHWVRELELPFPAAVVLFRWEYESMFLACLDSIAGKPIVGDSGIERPGLEPTAVFHGDPDHGPRGAKEWLTRHMPTQAAYKPSTDQLALTRMLDLESEKLNRLPSFVRLRRGLRFLAEHQGQSGTVYPGGPLG